MNDDESFVLLNDKSNNEMHEFEGVSYSVIIAKAYSYLLRRLEVNGTFTSYPRNVFIFPYKYL